MAYQDTEFGQRGLVQTLAYLSRDDWTSIALEMGDMPSENHIELEIALRKIHELAMQDGDLGYAYWHKVGHLLQRAASMQAEIDSLRRELEQCRAIRAKT
jgi:hypothetical protein